MRVSECLRGVLFFYPYLLNFQQEMKWNHNQNNLEWLFVGGREVLYGTDRNIMNDIGLNTLTLVRLNAAEGRDRRAFATKNLLAVLCLSLLTAAPGFVIIDAIKLPLP